jgi:hypothetical protein
VATDKVKKVFRVLGIVHSEKLMSGRDAAIALDNAVNYKEPRSFDNF